MVKDKEGRAIDDVDGAISFQSCNNLWSVTV